MNLERELGHHAEVAPAAAAQCPEQVRVLVGTGFDGIAVGRDNAGGNQTVTSEAEFPRRHSVTATQGKTGNTDRPAGAGGQRELLREERDRHVAQQATGPDAALIWFGASMVMPSIFLTSITRPGQEENPS